MSVIIKGKETDRRIAEGLRDTFVSQYNDVAAFQMLLDTLGDNCLDRLIHRLKIEEKIDLFKDYVALKSIAEEVRAKGNREIFIEVCKEDEARAWINDNGKYHPLVFEALYKVYRNSERLAPYLKDKKEKR
ncbi:MULTISPECIES: hypothetical protein [Cellulosilyticum]|uniref:Uncharacterized protein n=1 Tax=Cellulosilyticum lentocellum (strain ATCC 49066 / DSM 5427 / NCIMB 11756 / RHM5) TaxID=642492 RepID=F2JHN1_CELLD|nr:MULTISPECIES: hypothetical protein [Cellulosilyticum]ADZ84270.1 hypothetical protein Clole_2567 [Cellulosilyticum lentocellum DSM 5427]QEH69767.1 hypothetical protein EKH84_15750 [Cellulosilyticum sp. WCF-2]